VSKRIVGLTVEYSLGVVKAVGSSTVFECVENPEACCDGTGTGELSTGCCYLSQPNDTVQFLVNGPFGFACTECEFGGDLTYDDNLVWTFPITENECNVDLEMKLYCDAGHWKVSGKFILPDGTEVPFDVPAIISPTTGALIGVVAIPGCPTPAMIGIDSPCEGAVSWICLDNETCTAISGPDGEFTSKSECESNCPAAPVNCCPDTSKSLYFEVVSTTGTCGCFAGTSTVVPYIGGGGAGPTWNNTGGLGYQPCSYPCSISLTCNGSGEYTNLNFTGTNSSINVVSCSPYEAYGYTEMSTVPPGLNCTGTVIWRITEY